MELAIPIIALVGLVAIKSRKEKFKTMENTYLPNTNLQPLNYPKEENNSTTSAVTDKYFTRSMYQSQNLPNTEKVNRVQSLTGNYIDAKDFTHENMTPFYTNKMGSNLGVIPNDTLDSMAGSTKSIKKTEQAPLFKPQNDINWANGMPNMDEFYLSRVNKSVMKNDERPFTSEMVAPGLNKGYETSGSGGYNSGMEAREKWMDKNVDELRVETNPKVSYKLDNLEGPSKSLVSNLGLQAPVNKNLPDSFYEITPERYFTTPTSKGPMMHSEELLKDQHRIDTTKSYAGPPTAPIKQTGYVNKKYEESTRVPLPTSAPIPSAVGKGNLSGSNQTLSLIHI